MFGFGDKELKEDIRVRARQMAGAGFYDLVELTQALEQMAEDEGKPGLARFARSEAKAAWDARRREEASWPAVTDCDRLDRAFEELEGAGVLARHNYWCCMTCGCAAIDKELEDAERAGQRARGYVFYHEQDTDRAVEGDGLYLCYGADAQGDAAAVEIGREVVALLTTHGLKPDWDGDLKQRIRLPLDWRRRVG